MIKVQNTTTFWAWGFESFRVYCQDIASRSLLAVNRKTVAECQEMPSCNKIFLFPRLVHTLEDRGGLISSQLRPWQIQQQTVSCMLCPPIHMCYQRRIDLWWGLCGLASALLVTHAQTKSPNLPAPRFLPHLWNSKRTLYFTGLLSWW